MRRMMMIALWLGTMAGAAAADQSYAVYLSVPDQSGKGTDSVTGTVTVDKLGTLTAADFVSYMLKFTDPTGATSTLTQANGQVVLGPLITVTASATSLTVTLPSASSVNEGTRFAIERQGTELPSVEYVVENIPDTVGGFFQSESFGIILNTTYEGSQSLPVIGGTYTFATVPEPSSLALCAIAGVVGLAVARARRKRT